MTTQKALIVDDSRTAQVKLKRMLRPYPLEVDTVDSGEEALSYLNGEHPAVIFMDHSMPGMDGLEALRIIRSNTKTAALPVIMYTAQQGDVYIGRAEAAGANDVLSKDVMDDRGLEKVLRFLRLTEPNQTAKRQNVTPISGRLAEKIHEADEGRAIAATLSGRNSSAANVSDDTESAIDTATPTASVENETKSAESWEEALAEATSNNQKMLQDAINQMKNLPQREAQHNYAPAPQRLHSEASENARPIWPSFLIIGLLFFVIYQLIEIRNDQSELDRAVQEIQIRMEVE